MQERQRYPSPAMNRVLRVPSSCHLPSSLPLQRKVRSEIQTRLQSHRALSYSVCFRSAY